MRILPNSGFLDAVLGVFVLSKTHHLKKDYTASLMKSLHTIQPLTIAKKLTFRKH
jgi:hypothetical protein